MDYQASHTFTASPTSLDESGVFWLQDNQEVTQSFVASRILIKRISGPQKLNFDFVGTFYDFETAKDNAHDDSQEDGWNDVDISSYWVKGTSQTHYILFIMTFCCDQATPLELS